MAPQHAMLWWHVQGGSMTAVMQTAFTLDINATIQKVLTTQAQLLQVWSAIAIQKQLDCKPHEV